MDYAFEFPDAEVDSNWAPRPDCRSTTGAILSIDGFHLLTLCKTQMVIALSSCEAELLATNYAACEGLFLCHVLQELNFPAVLRLYTDSSSNLATLCRRGVGRMRHLEAKDIWLQDQLRDHNLEIYKIQSDQNAADILTKHLTPKVFQSKVKQLGWVNTTETRLESDEEED